MRTTYLIFLKPHFLRKAQFHITVVFLYLINYIFITIDLATNGQQVVALILVQFAVANNLVDTFGTTFVKPIYISQLLLVFLSTSLKFYHSEFGYWITLTSPIIMILTFISSARLVMLFFLLNEKKMLIPLVSHYPEFTIFILSLTLFSNLSKSEKMFIFEWSPSKTIRISNPNSCESIDNHITCDPEDNGENLKVIGLREAILQIINYRFY
ncbi:4096_t:CDS:1 [Cetraspora pellucida]|uniref:4096_t:CDS:1 n=1 Tax=Cetraspora pellucida TaxID=1433469 RepID=A0ACA9KP87_9GLOM|nr:4096_t:CDS:1 [Cetraspora pellucida]